MKKYKGREKVLVFDIDNTIYPKGSGLYEDILERIDLFLQKRLGITREEASKLRHVYYLKYGTTLMGIKTEQPHIDFEDYIKFVYVHDPKDFIKNDDKLVKTLSRVKNKKIIFTDGPKEHALKVMNFLNITRFFDHISDLRSRNFLSKPTQDSFKKFFEEANIEPENAVFIEDSKKNLKAAKHLGMTTVLVSQEEEKQKPEYVDFVISSIDELEKLNL